MLRKADETTINESLIHSKKEPVPYFVLHASTSIIQLIIIVLSELTLSLEFLYRPSLYSVLSVLPVKLYPIFTSLLLIMRLMKPTISLKQDENSIPIIKPLYIALISKRSESNLWWSHMKG